MKPREINNVEFFIKWLNKTQNLDYEIDDSFHDENSPVDVILKSPTIKKNVQIQNVAYRDGTIYGYGESNIPGFRPLFVLGTAMSKDERINSIFDCIRFKRDKYPDSIVKNTVLIIEITIPSIKPEEIEEMPKNEEFGFKGIYFVQLPISIPAIDDKYSQTGYVHAYKECDFK
jgi:hypothetical protein